ncbi:MAG: hypothetical protein ABIK98_06930 [Pseudomonadota bacterium]|uniref:Uncharacterized protein n=1 Tax=Candidatus Desulfatibia profunda TaxID=2841695 RepID=A0A8J6P003_9BACT|nr:hypothetical protein [Candidatus Desulfatibia profunda]MBL7179032.1 hypothetical protein [Desulfobacterales bacterium]MBU0698278.1 hypothetical protein [Pseudomonadota bacterium]
MNLKRIFLLMLMMFFAVILFSACSYRQSIKKDAGVAKDASVSLVIETEASRIDAARAAGNSLLDESLKAAKDPVDLLQEMQR